jgi:hypothetical protein
MYLKTTYSCLFFLLCGFAVKAQKTTTEISFQLLFDNLPLELTKQYPVSEKDTLTIDFLKFYISDITFLKEGTQVGKSKEKHHLIDAQHSLIYKALCTIKNKNFDTITFLVGLDSKTQEKGIQGGVLDPTSQMYWTWQNGFINFKLEGESSLCPTRKNKFQFHIGGFQEPYATSQEVSLKAKGATPLVIEVDVASFFNAIDISQTNTVTSPNKNAVMVSKVLPTLFSVHEN